MLSAPDEVAPPAVEAAVLMCVLDALDLLQAQGRLLSTLVTLYLV